MSTRRIIAKAIGVVNRIGDIWRGLGDNELNVKAIFFQSQLKKLGFGLSSRGKWRGNIEGIKKPASAGYANLL